MHNLRDFEAIYVVVRNIPPGSVMSYGGVGAAANTGARTVGWAMSAAPDGVPWYRVVAWNGYLSVAKRDPHLRRMQESLLRAEGVVVTEAGYVEKRFLLDPNEIPEA